MSRYDAPLLRSRLGLGGGALLALALAGCPKGPLTTDLAAKLAGKPNAYLAGTVASAEVLHTLNRRDFVYDVEVDRSSHRVAYSHLGLKTFRVGLLEGQPDLLASAPPKVLADVEISANDFEVEALAFSPDGQRVACADRDGAVRLLDLSGKVLARTPTEDELTALAFSPDGHTVVAGNRTGLLTVLDAERLDFLGDLRAHSDRVSALAYDDAGALYSAAWDGKVRRYTVGRETRPVAEARLRLEKTGTLTGVHATLDDKAPVTLAFDERSEVTTLSPQAAQAAGIDTAFLKDRVQVPTPGGRVELPVARDRTLRFKNLIVPHVDLAICAACQPPGVDGLLGKSFLERHEVVLDEQSHEAVLRLKDASSAQPQLVAALTPEGAPLEPGGFVQDLTVSRDGSRLGLALDAERPVRTLALYQREKAGEQEPEVPGNVAVIVDAKTGAVLEKHGGHHGVVATASISPDGRSLASGGWDKAVRLYSGAEAPVAELQYGWAVRKVRFSPDGRLLAVGAWTPQNAQNSDSAPSAQLIRLGYSQAEAREGR